MRWLRCRARYFELPSREYPKDAEEHRTVDRSHCISWKPSTTTWQARTHYCGIYEIQMMKKQWNGEKGEPGRKNRTLLLIVSRDIDVAIALVTSY